MKLDKKRRRERKTNYNKRLKLLKRGYKRLIIRKSNKYIILQIIKSENAKDKILCSVNSKELLKLGWPEDKKGSLKSLIAAYLSGYLLGKRAKDMDEKIILDIGLIPSTKGSRVYAAIKGASEAGINIDYNEKIMPDEERLKAGKIDEETFNKIKETIK